MNLEAKYGIYYIQIFYNLKDTIAYDEPTEGASVPAPQSILGGSLVLEYKPDDEIPKGPKENIYENVQVRELAKSMFVTDIKVIDSTDNVPENYVDKSIYIYISFILFLPLSYFSCSSFSFIYSLFSFLYCI